MDFKNKIKIILWLIFSLVVFFILYFAIVPFGKISYTYIPGKDNFFIGKLTPEERVEKAENGIQKIIGNPIYFSLRTSRKFDKAKLTLKYKNESQPIIEAGVLADKKLWSYDLKPVENTILDNLSNKWIKVKNGNNILLQREKKYNTIDEFLNKLPKTEEMAAYNYSLKADYYLPGYEPSREGWTFNSSLRGAYQFYAYIKNENLNYRFIILDMNLNRDPDPIEINIYKNNDLVLSKNLVDDGNSDDNGKVGADRELIISIPALAEGAYKIEFKANNDIITKKIVTTNKKLSFINRIWLTGGEKKIKIYTDSNQIKAQTTIPAGLQVVSVDGQKLDINETYKQFNIKTIKKISEAILKDTDLILAGEGVFSLNQDRLINPSAQKINENTDIDKDGINYIIADYNKTETDDGWKTAETEFDLSNSYRENQRYSFLISMPGLNENGTSSKVELKEIKVELEGKSLWEYLRKFFK